jgi:hypothetical protein
MPKLTAADLRALLAAETADALSAAARVVRLLEHDPEKWVPVFGKDHAAAIR